MSSTYNKPFLPVEDQVAHLTARGMQISDREDCIKHLQAIGYYRLSGYWYPFREMSKASGGLRSSNFTSGTTFKEVLELYYFDEGLRAEMLRAISRIEVALRFWVGHKLGKRSQFSHLEKDQLDPAWSTEHTRSCGAPGCSTNCTWDESEHGRWIAKQRKAEDISNETFVAHIYNSYGEPLPIWAATETMTFETLNRLYSGMTVQDREQIALEFDVFRADGNGDSGALSNWIEHLRQTRNVCAHHARLWNRNNTAPPALPDSASELKHLSIPDPQGGPTPVSRESSRLYATIALISYLLARIDRSNEARDQLLSIVLDFSQKQPERLHAMGFPAGWERQDIWAANYRRDPARTEQARLLRDIDLLYTKDAAARLTVKPTEAERRSTLNYYRKNGALLSVPGTEAWRYPAFQFDDESGNINDLAILANRRLLEGGNASAEKRWNALKWWLSPIQMPDVSVTPKQALENGLLTKDLLDRLLDTRGDE